MAASTATTVAQYLAELPPDRRVVVARVRDVVRANLPAGYEESVSWGMICWSIPLSRYPDTYNGQPLGYACLAAQKNHYALYLTCLYMDAEQSAAFARAFTAAGHRLDMGKSCLRFRTIDELPLDVIGREIARTPPDEYIALYERSRAAAAKQRAGTAATKVGAKQKVAAKQKATAKKAAKKAASTRAAAKSRRDANERT